MERRSWDLHGGGKEGQNRNREEGSQLCCVLSGFVLPVNVGVVDKYNIS